MYKIIKLLLICSTGGSRGGTGGQGAMAPQTEKIFFFLHYLKKMYENFFLHYFLNYSGRKTHSTTPLRIHGTSSTYPPPLKIGLENSINYPPSNSRNLIDYYPPSKSGRKTPSTTPPRNSRPERKFTPPNSKIQFLDPPLICSTNSLI